MQSIFIYGDSLTWGIVPGTRRRLPLAQRWAGILESRLNAAGRNVRVIEDCLNGRRTVWEDPYKAGRNGLIGLPQRIEVNSPLALIIVMLGTNDFQSSHQNNAWQSAQGVATLVRAIRSAPIEPGMTIPPILILAPPAIKDPKGANVGPKFAGAEERCAGMAAACRQMAADENCAFFDASAVARVSVIDGVHLDADQHERLGLALVEPVAALLGQAAAG